MLSCNQLSNVITFPTFSKLKDSTYSEAYECTREDDKMAPRFCSAGDLCRYHLRAPKHKRLDSSIEAATVSNKIDFLRCMGLVLSTPQIQGLNCAFCHQIECICDMRKNLVDNVTMKVQYETASIPLKPCSVQITGIECKVCKKLFKCETDVRDHMKIRHRHRLKVTLKFDKETMSTKWIKKSHLKRHRSHPGYSHAGYQVSQASIDDFDENSVESIIGRDVSKIRNIKSRKPQDGLARRLCSAPSLGIAIDRPFCQTENCHCCLRNNIRPSDDNNNNNNCPKFYLPSKPEEFVDSMPVRSSKTCRSHLHHVAHHKTIELNSISCQTPDWIQGSILVTNRIDDKDVITLDDTEDLSNDVTEIPIEPPCYDLTEDENYKSDDEVEKVLEIRKNQLPFITPNREVNDSGKGLRISDAIRDLMIAEHSLSNDDQEDSEMREPSRNSHQQDLNVMEDDEEDDFTLRFDDSEESCTFFIKDTVGNKEYSKSYTADFFEDTHFEMAVDHHDALEQASNFWQTPTKNVERFSAFEASIDYVGDRYSMIAIKEELTLDHYLFDRE